MNLIVAVKRSKKKIKREKLGKNNKENKLKRRNKLLVYEGKKGEKTASLNLCMFSASIAAAERLVLFLHMQC